MLRLTLHYTVYCTTVVLYIFCVSAQLCCGLRRISLSLSISRLTLLVAHLRVSFFALSLWWCCYIFSKMSILEYNGAAMIAMVGKDCVGIATDVHLGIQAQTISTDFIKVFEMSPHLFCGLAGLATDVQTLHNLLKFCMELYSL